MQHSQTERTHEENVERAFIAASRRCDRTLEARVESAKRASEIHKARTGRGLKITAKDVQNEEMYEEEEDDLPLQYRHLTAGFQTSSPEFNRRFAAYLTTHVAIRTALEQSIIQSYQQQQEQQQQQQQLNPDQSLPYQIQPQQYEMFPSPFLAHNAQQSQRIMSTAQSSPTTRFSPYPILSRTNVASSVSPKTVSSIKTSSSPLITNNSFKSEAQTDVQPNLSLSSNSSHLSPLLSSVSYPLFQFSIRSENLTHLSKTLQNDDSPGQYTIPNYLDLTSLGPLSTNLPAETQAFLGSSMGLGNTSGGPPYALDPQQGEADLFEPALKSNKISSESKNESKTTTHGLDMTLLPEASAGDSPYLFGDSNYFDDALRADSVMALNSTPANEENNWSDFVEPSDWSFS